MVAKKEKATKTMKDLGARKLTSAQARKIKGGTGGGGTKKVVKGWIDI
jgi:hypothetical protein